MHYRDRIAAAEKLSLLLKNYKNKKEILILALPRGGVIVGDVISKNLNLPLDVIIPKKLLSPVSEELAIGAICEESIFLNDELIKDLKVTKEFIQKEIDEKKKQIIERKKLYKKDKTTLDLKNKTIILVDDGIATGATIIAAIYAIKEKQAKKIIVAAPVGAYTTIEKLKSLVEEVICPLLPDDFYAIGQFYDNFEEITDAKVIKILESNS